MMKYAAILLVALLGVANATLKDDLAEFKALIPIDEMKELTAYYAAHDAEFQIAVAYLKGEEFRGIVDAIGGTPEWQEFVDYMDEAGMDIVGLIESISRLLDTSSFTVRSSARPSTRSFHGWMDAILAMIPLTEIRALYDEKMVTSAEFQEFAGIISGEKAQSLAATLADTTEWQSLLTKGRNHGVPVDAWLSIIYNIMGWN